MSVRGGSRFTMGPRGESSLEGGGIWQRGGFCPVLVLEVSVGWGLRQFYFVLCRFG